LHQVKLFCAESGLETFRSKSVEICLMAIYLQSNRIVRIKSLASHEIRIITNNLHHNRAEYRLQTRLNLHQRFRV